MSDQMTLSATHIATSLPGSADGAMPPDWPDGPTKDHSGPAHAPVSRSVEQTPSGNAGGGWPTSATFGRTGTRLLRSAALQLSLESRLRTRLPVAGWTKFLTTWRRLITPAGRCLWQLSVSVRHRNANEFGLYATPTRSDGKGSVSLKRTLERAAQSTRGVRLPEQLVRIEERDGYPNPAFVCWLMGFPPEWETCAPTATPSSRKSARNSCVPI